MTKRAKIGVVIHAPLRERLFSEQSHHDLSELGDVRWTESEEPVSVEDAIEILADCDIGIGSWSSPYPTEELLRACPNLRLWEHVAGSVKMMFGPHLEGRDLTIASCAPAIAENVAEMTLGEILLGVRNVFPNAYGNRTGTAPKGSENRGLSGVIVGVIGASLVGRKLIEMMKPFRPKVLLYDPFVTAEEAVILGAELCSDLHDLCMRSAVVTLHTPATEATNKMLGASHFQAMADDAILINTARGTCIDEEALIAELSKGRLFAFLDVTNPEPAAPDSPLRQLPNVVLTSHIAGPPDTKLGEQAVRDAAAFLQGEAPERVVTQEMLTTIA